MALNDEEDVDSDAPLEISSKKKADLMLVGDEEPQMSFYEQIQAKKQKEEEKKEKQQKKRRRRVKKVQEGGYIIKSNKAEFKVVTLEKGIKKPLEPSVNFKAELLKARTEQGRSLFSKGISHRAKWASKAS